MTQELPRPFGGIQAFSQLELQTFWGITFLSVAALAAISEFIVNTFTRNVMILPQQIVLTYGALALAAAMVEDPNNIRTMLAASYSIPVAVMHVSSMFTRR